MVPAHYYYIRDLQYIKEKDGQRYKYGHNPIITVCVRFVKDEKGNYIKAKIGVAICGLEDNPNKKTGRMIAYRRTFDEPMPETSTLKILLQSKQSINPLLDNSRVKKFPELKDAILNHKLLDESYTKSLCNLTPIEKWFFDTEVKNNE